MSSFHPRVCFFFFFVNLSHCLAAFLVHHFSACFTIASLEAMFEGIENCLRYSQWQMGKGRFYSSIVLDWF